MMERLTNGIDYCKMHCDFGKSNECFFSDKDKCYERSIYNRLREHEELEEQGLMLKLPCKVGDTVYCIEDKKIWNCIVDKVTISRTNGVWFEVKTPKSMPDISAIEYTENDIGKTVFLTETEAEQKLKEMNTDNGIAE